MPPKELPALQPEQSVRPEAAVAAARPHRQRQQRLAALFVVSTAIIVLATYVGWRLYLSPQAVMSDALHHFAQASQAQLDGSLRAKATEQSDADGATIAFRGGKQQNNIYMNSVLTFASSQQTVDIPAEVFVDETQTSYVSIKDAAFFDGLIRDANPAAALQLLRADAIFSNQLKGKWLQLQPHEMAAMHEQLAASNTVQALPAQTCLVGLLAGDKQANRQLLTGLGESLGDQPITKVNEENVRTIPSGHYQIALEAAELERIWSEQPATPEVKRFNECIRTQPGLQAPGLTIDAWISQEKRQFNRLQATFDMGEQQLVFTSNIAYEATEPKPVPAEAVTMAEIEQNTADDKTAIDAIFQRRLAAFPTLNALVRELQADEEELRT